MKQLPNCGTDGGSGNQNSCPSWHRYGHKEDTCYAKRDFVAGRLLFIPPENVISKRLKRYKEKLKLKSQRKYPGVGRKMQQVENEETDVDNEM
eukprot:snap_masked-scaffold_70-processed-gene-0.34-mRNA-1 protein AED:1.00 eAED:1.00 QI:0/0/0/0/1/1/2/0/92